MHDPFTVAEDEFFSPGEKLSSGTKASLAMIAAKQVLVSYPWGELKFKDAETEYSWRMCVPLEPLPNQDGPAHPCPTPQRTDEQITPTRLPGFEARPCSSSPVIRPDARVPCLASLAHAGTPKQCTGGESTWRLPAY
jgi:hypothetical protein